MRKEKLYFLTNRMNALPILSSGLLRSREAYGKKYYADFLEKIPGRILFWRGAYPANVVEEIESQGKIGFPVIFEINSIGFEAERIFSLYSSLDIKETSGTLDNDVIAFLLEGAVPISNIEALHFRSDDERKDFATQKMGNLDTEFCELITSPDLFNSRDIDWEKLNKTIASLPRVNLEGRAEVYSKIDVYAGAATMMSAAMPGTMQWADVFVALLERQEVKECCFDSCVCECLGGLYKLIFHGQNDSFAKCKNRWESHVFSEAIIKLASDTGSKGLNSIKFIQELFDKLLAPSPAKNKDKTALQSSLFDGGDNNDNELTKARDYIVSVLKNEIELKNLDDSGSLCLRALTLFLLRKEPYHILESRHSNIHPGENVLTLAAVLGGIHSGYARLQTDIKNKAGDATIFSKFMARWCNDAIKSGFIPVPLKETETKIEVKKEDAIHKRVFVKAGKTVLKSFSQSPDEAMMVIYQQLKLAKCNLDYDFEKELFSFKFEFDGGRKQLVYVRSGAKNEQGKHTVRFMSPCLQLEGDAKKALKQHIAVDLLIRNDNPETFCRFALNTEMNAILVEVDQIVETADQDELIAHLYQVAKTADDYERELGIDVF